MLFLCGTSYAIENSGLNDPDWHYGVFMEIFVRAYQDSDGDGIGDLRGLTSRLDYLKELGIRGIWLMPVMPSADHDHGYATTDYRSIEPQYGTLEDFRELLHEAHQRGIGIITDYVINHSAESHPFFTASRSAPDNPYRNWYVWEKDAPKGWDIWGKDPWNTTNSGAYFSTFGSSMPDFNLRNPDVVNYHFDTLRYWLGIGLDGFRMDAVPHMIENSAIEWQDQPENRALAKTITELINEYPHRYVVCEATADPIGYASPDVCGSSFVFGWDYPIANAAKGDRKAIAKLANFFSRAPASMGTMVSNHDIFAGKRLWDQINGDQTTYRLAAATYLLQAGRPFIYYGEEVGMAGAGKLKGDFPLRSPMSWNSDTGNAGFTTGKPFRPVAPNARRYNVASQQKDPNSILSFYKTILGLRNSMPSLSRGAYLNPVAVGQTMHFMRRLGNETTLVTFNYGRGKASIKVTGVQSQNQLVLIYPKSERQVQSGGKMLHLTLPPRSVRIYRVRSAP